MKRQVADKLMGQAHYSTRLSGYLRWAMVGVFSIACLSAAGCQPLPVPVESTGSESTLPASTATESANEETDKEEESAMPDLSDAEQMLVELASADLSTELGVGADQISVSSVQAVDFPDASLGCPEDGMMYAQVITSGYVLMLEVDGTQYEYHGTPNGEGYIVRCESEK